MGSHTETSLCSRQYKTGPKPRTKTNKTSKMKFSLKNYTRKSSARADKKDDLTSAEKVQRFQDRLAKQCEEILSDKLEKKIAELDELCCREELWSMTRIAEIRSETESMLTKYLEDIKDMSEDEGSSNPLLQLLTGGASASKEEDPEQEVASRKPSKMLLSKIKLSEDNKVNLKLSIELDGLKEKIKESLSKESLVSLNEEGPPAKKSKTDLKNSEEEKEAEEAEASAIDAEAEAEAEADEAASKKEPVLKSHPLIVELIQTIKPHIDQIVSWCVTLRVYLLNSMQRNKNLGGADLNAECQAVIIEEIKGLEDEFSAYKEALSAYYLTKATILEKYVKSPEMEDLKNFILDEDEKMFVNCRTIIMALRNQTLSLFDAIQKDSDRLFSNESTSASASFGMY